MVRESRRVILTTLFAAAACGSTLVGSIPAAQAKTCHLVIFCDTDDLLIGDGCKLDGDSIEGVFRTHVVAKNLKIERFSGNKLSRKRVIDTLRRKRLRSDDTLVFYFSGHGGFDSRQGQFLIVGPKASNSGDRYLLRKTLTDTMKRTGAGLNVVLTDCCSNMIKIKKTKTFGSVSPSAKPLVKTSPAFRSLFFKPVGLVDFTSSSRGQISVGDSADGGYFTVILTGYLARNAKREVTWKALSREVQTKTSARFRTKNPTGVQYRSSRGNRVTQRDQTPRCTIALTDKPGPSNNNDAGLPPPIATGPRFGVRAIERNGRLVITQVVPGSPATRVKVVGIRGLQQLQKRDIILEINGRRLFTEQQYGDAVDRSPRRMKMKVINHGDNRRYDLEVILAR